MAGEPEGDVVELQQAFQRAGPLEIRVRALSLVVRVHREVPERELELARMRGEVVREPLVLGAGRRPVIVVVVLVDVGRAGVRVVPGGVEYVEAGVTGVERVPGARISGSR